LCLFILSSFSLDVDTKPLFIVAYVPVVNRTVTPPLEADLSEEHEQNTIAWALANDHGKEGSVATMQQLPLQPAIGSIPPTRIRSVPTRETGKNCVATVRQFYSRSSLADFSSGQLILCN
jgi:hypothetical protein